MQCLNDLDALLLDAPKIRKADAHTAAQFEIKFGKVRCAIADELRRLAADVDRLTGDNAALSEALDTALLHLAESEADRDAWQFKHNDMVARYDRAQKNASIERIRIEQERDALAAELAQVRAQLEAVPDVRKMSVGQLQVIRDAATNRLYEVYCAGLEQA
jgi:small-conductance mechanosensitive channel